MQTPASAVSPTARRPTSARRTPRTSSSRASSYAPPDASLAQTVRELSAALRLRDQQLADCTQRLEARRGGPTASTLLDEVERLSRQNEELLLDNQSLRQRLRDDEAASDAAAEDRALGDAFLGRAAEHLHRQGSEELLAEAELLWGAGDN